jgi:hypothetical protein
VNAALVIANDIDNASPASGLAFACGMGHAIGLQQTGHHASPGGVGA